MQISPQQPEFDRRITASPIGLDIVPESASTDQSSSLSAKRVDVISGSRLHFGLLWGTHGSVGGAGVMIERPAVWIRLSPSPRFEVRGPAADRAVETANRYFAAYSAMRGSGPGLPRLTIHILRMPPSHAGFGSGTQLALSIACGLDRYFQVSHEPLELAASIAGRGKRSAVGTHGFFRGGLITELGRPTQDSLQPVGILSHHRTLPPAWRWLVMQFPEVTVGVSGAAEQQRFEALHRIGPPDIDRWHRMLQLEMVPAVDRADVDDFGEAIYQFNRAVGEHFASVQGGLYGSHRAAACVDRLRAWGVRGVGQSSWGPTLFALCESPEASADLQARIQAEAKRFGSCFERVELSSTATRNRPATLASRSFD
jgi:beta-RFAP synthase